MKLELQPKLICNNAGEISVHLYFPRGNTQDQSIKECAVLFVPLSQFKLSIKN